MEYEYNVKSGLHVYSLRELDNDFSTNASRNQTCGLNTYAPILFETYILFCFVCEDDNMAIARFFDVIFYYFQALGICIYASWNSVRR
jgi:HJR/Mrr/RecB family endonuclease